MIKRTLDLRRLSPQHRSAFLFGPRGTGKTHLSRSFLQTRPHTYIVNLLESDIYKRYLLEPHVFRLDVENLLRKGTPQCVLVDEVQKLPILLDEVHHLLETYKGQIQFLLTGSSARKLKRGGANLLAGRAWTLKLHPLTHEETPIDLSRALTIGTLPAIYLDDRDPQTTLRAYVDTYLKEEIFQEGLVRKLDAFTRFLEYAGQMNGEPINFRTAGRSAGISDKTAESFFEILVDTLMVTRIPGWSRSVRKQLLQAPKYYWFDCGVLNALRGELTARLSPGSFRYGRLFETWVIQEIIRMNDYKETDYKFHYWRTSTGQEVDLILQQGVSGPPIAIEIKSDPSPAASDLKSLHLFKADNPEARLLCFCTSPIASIRDGIEILPWAEGLTTLFSTSSS